MDRVPEKDTSRHPPPAHAQDTNYIGINIGDHEDTSKLDTTSSESLPPSGQHHSLESFPRHASGGLVSINTKTPVLGSPIPGQTSHDPPPSPCYLPSPLTTPQSAFRQVYSQADLRPDTQFPKSNRLAKMTINLTTTYQQCSSGFDYSTAHNPRRVLTKPNKPCGNDGYDNVDYDYILYVNDILGAPGGQRYLILDVLGAGTFGQVVKCENLKTHDVVAVKVVKNKLAYFKQSTMEMAVLELLNQRCDPEDKHHILRLKDTFMHRKHLCLVFELLSVNLYELIRQNQFRGLSTNLIRVFAAQILDCLTILNEARVIHCDLKPENILLKNLDSPTIKVIDFGSACFEQQTTYTYIQSRFYRSPEVLLGLPYTSAIDMWSLGCIAAELFLGLPLFPGSSEYNQISRIVDMLGIPPTYMLEMGKNAHRYFERVVNERGEKQYKMIPMETYASKHKKLEQPSKQYFSARYLPDLINNYPVARKGSLSQKEIDKEKHNRLVFIDFLQGVLNLNHLERWSPQQARQHPFFTGEPFLGPFKPPFIPRKQPQTAKIPRSMPTLSIPEPPVLLPAIHNFSPPYSSNGNIAPRTLPAAPSGGKHMAESQTYLSPSSAFPAQPKLGPLTESKDPSMGDDMTKRHAKQTAHSILPLPLVLEPTDISPYSHPNNAPNPVDPGFSPASPHSAGSCGRPRANTIGATQMPPRQYWAAPHAPVDQDNTAAFNDPSATTDYHDGFAEFQGIKVDPLQASHGPTSSRIDPGGHAMSLPLPVSTRDTSRERWENQARLIDLERDGDWKEDTSRRAFHRRSNSSVRFSDISLPSSSAARSSVVNNVASFHRFVRGQLLPYNRQDLEWDGIHDMGSSTQNLVPSSFGLPSWRANRNNRMIHSWCEE